MVNRKRLPAGPRDAQQVATILERQYRELLPFLTWLPIRSPAKAALKTLLEQQTEIITIVTGDPNRLRAKTGYTGSWD